MPHAHFSGVVGSSSGSLGFHLKEIIKLMLESLFSTIWRQGLMSTVGVVDLKIEGRWCFICGGHILKICSSVFCLWLFIILSCSL